MKFKVWSVGVRSVFMVVAACAVAHTSNVIADITLSPIFTSNMVLQRGLPINVWGLAKPGAEILVRLDASEAKVTADADGRWMATLPSRESGVGLELAVVGRNTIVLKNVAIGDVWVCSGQSNMEMALEKCDAPQDVAAADLPDIRHLKVGKQAVSTPADEIRPTSEGWQVCTPQTAGKFTAVGYYFAREIQQQTAVPIGLVNSTWGGTTIECWIDLESLDRFSELSSVRKGRDERVAKFRAELPGQLDRIDAWLVACRERVVKNQPLPPAPPLPVDPLVTENGWPQIHSLSNGMVRPLTRFPIKGVIWYQGEANGTDGDMYFFKMRALVEGWRGLWRQGDFPFYFVQLASYMGPNQKPAGGDYWAQIRCAQTKSLGIPNTGMASAVDIGEAKDIHPKNKLDIGRRLALWALNRDYGKTDVVPSGPLFKSATVEKPANGIGHGRMRITFDFSGGGLMVGRKNGCDPVVEDKERKLALFATAGKDRKWVWADAAIDGDTVIVSSPEVPEPVAVRYAFTTNTDAANLYNRAGLPASPFRTDDWPL